MAKPLIAAMAGALAITGLAACSSDDSGSDGKKSKAAESVKSTPKPKSQVEGLSAQDVARKAKAAMLAAGSMKIAGTGISDGKPMQLALSVTKAGECTGTIAMGKASTKLIVTGPEYFMKPSADFLAETGASAKDAQTFEQVLNGRWMKGNSTTGDNGLSGVCDLKSMLKDEKNPASLKLGAPTTIAGVKVVTVEKKKGAETQRMYVAAEGAPYLQKDEAIGGKEPHAVTFSEFDKPVKVTAPAPGDTLDMAKLG
jgi:hypothetical protein